MKNLQKLSFVGTVHRVVFKLLELFVGNVVFTSAFPLNQQSFIGLKIPKYLPASQKEKPRKIKEFYSVVTQTKDNNSSNNTLRNTQSPLY